MKGDIMCQEVFQIVQTMDLSQVETKFALQCAPVITGMKVSNLLIIDSCDEDKVRSILKKTGLLYYRLLRRNEKTTFLVFRKTPLAIYLQDSHVQQLLKANGYTDLSLGGILRTFQYRFVAHMSQGEGFPHEMGLLLGYPVEDVEGFIRYKGKKYLYSGYWKVYSHAEEKKKLFAMYECGKEQLIQLLSEGYSIREIIEGYQDVVMKQAS